MTHHIVNTGNPSSPASGDAVGGSPNSEVPMAEQVAVPFPSWEAWSRIRNGGLMPPIEQDRELYELQKQFASKNITYIACVSCKEGFSDNNCFTQPGWQETQISGLCERCFDETFAEDESDDWEEALNEF